MHLSWRTSNANHYIKRIYAPTTHTPVSRKRTYLQLHSAVYYNIRGAPLTVGITYIILTSDSATAECTYAECVRII